MRLFLLRKDGQFFGLCHQSILITGTPCGRDFNDSDMPLKEMMHFPIPGTAQILGQIHIAFSNAGAVTLRELHRH